MTHNTPTSTPVVIPITTGSTSATYKPKPFTRREAIGAIRPFAKPPSLDNPVVMELVKMHTYCRPAGTQTEAAFCLKYIDSIPGMITDMAGNRLIRVGSAADHPVLWSSHTDTVHSSGGKQKVTYGDGILTLSDGSESSCLGADCTVGVWLMRQMILANVPGLYVFHAEEECGGHGSKHIATVTPQVLDGIKYAIAFDRKNIHSIITHQWSRCASDAFGKALGDAIGSHCSLDTGGTFTDTANYTSLVPECTNISVGYYAQHTAKECLDVSYAVYLLDRIKRLDVNTLPVSRTPGNDDYDYGDYGGVYGGYGGAYGGNTSKRGYTAKPSATLEDLVWDNPELAAALLEQMGIDATDFQRALDDYYMTGKRR